MARVPGWLDGVRLLVFDADDTLRRTTVPGQPCPHRDGEWELLPGVAEVLEAVPWRDLDITVGVASNQDHVGYGHLTHGEAERMLREMILAATGGAVDDPLIRMCTHVLEVECECRKPQPGLLLGLLRATGVNAKHALFIGNAEVDREAARRAGVRFEWATVLHGSAALRRGSG